MTGPALSVTGVTSAHARRAVKWLKDRSLLAFYHKGELRAFEFKHGPDWTYDVLHRALRETCR